MKRLCAGSLLSLLVFGVLWQTPAIGQSPTSQVLVLEGVDLNLAIGLSQSRNLMGMLANQSINHNAKLGIRFSIADFVRRGQLTLNNKHNRPSNPRSVSDTFGLDLTLPVEFSDAFSTRVRLSGNAVFFPGDITKNNVKTSLNIENNFRLDAVQGRLNGKFDASVFPDLFPQTNSLSLRDTFTFNNSLNLQGRMSGASTSLQIAQGSTLIALDPNRNKSNFKFQSSASGGAGFLTLEGRFNTSLDTFQSRDDPIGDKDPRSTHLGEGCPGICLVDDDGDGLVDEDAFGVEQHLNPPVFDAQNPAFNSRFINDDDEDGRVDETADTMRFTASLASKLRFDDLNASASFSHSGSNNSDNPSGNNRQNRFQLSSNFTLFMIDWSARTDQTATRFSGNAIRDSNRINMSLASKVRVGDIQLSTTAAEVLTRLLNNPTGDQNNSSRSLNIRFPVAENLDLNIKPIGHQRTVFPNDPGRPDQITNQTSLAMNVKFDFGTVSLSLSQSEFPLTPSRNRITMSANASLRQDFVENVRMQTSASFSFSSSGVSTRLNFAVSARF